MRDSKIIEMIALLRFDHLLRGAPNTPLKQEKSEIAKQLRVWGLTILMVGLVAAPALAVTPTVNTVHTVSSVGMGLLRTITIVPGFGLDAARVSFTQNLSVSNLIQVTFVNGSFAAGSHRICETTTNSATPIAVFTPGGGTTQANFTVNVDTPAGNILALTTEAVCGDGAGGDADQVFAFQLNSVASAAGYVP